MKDKVCIRPSEFDTPWCIDEDINSGGVEYIRKEALLEWAKEKQYESLTIVADNFWQEVIDKLNSL